MQVCFTISLSKEYHWNRSLDCFRVTPPNWLRNKILPLSFSYTGFPNVGKSSVINSLVGKKVVSVSRTPGHTKYFQTYYLTKTVKLCDCPGLVFPSRVDKQLQVQANVCLFYRLCDVDLSLQNHLKYILPLSIPVLSFTSSWWNTGLFCLIDARLLCHTIVSLVCCILFPPCLSVFDFSRFCQASIRCLSCRSLIAQWVICVKGSHSSLCWSSNIPVCRRTIMKTSSLKSLAGRLGMCVRVSHLLFCLSELQFLKDFYTLHERNKCCS